jgi:hypothetical protein
MRSLVRLAYEERVRDPPRDAKRRDKVKELSHSVEQAFPSLDE